MWTLSTCPHRQTLVCLELPTEVASETQMHFAEVPSNREPIRPDLNGRGTPVSGTSASMMHMCPAGYCAEELPLTVELSGGSATGRLGLVDA